MGVSRFFQVVLGVTLSLGIFVGAGSLIVFLLMYRMWGQPPRPTFANDDPNYKSKVLAEAKTKKLQAKQAEQAKQAQNKPKPTATPTPKPTPTLEPGAYEAKVTWPEGLSIRSEPSYDSGAIGGIDFDTPVVVIGSSDDGVWDHIRVQSTGEKGWIKAGNVAKISTTETVSPTPTPTAEGTQSTEP